MAFQVSNNEKRQRFEIRLGEEYAYMDYRWNKGSIVLMHTFVPETGRGLGYSSALAKHAFEYAKGKSLKVMVYCPYVAKYLKEHPEYESLIDNQNQR